jgi:tRNA pseudouridine55 synthase
LQSGGTLAKLLRTESCGFSLSDSVTFDRLETQAQAGTLSLMPPEMALRHLPQITLPDAIAKRWCQGQKIPETAIAPLPDLPTVLRVHAQNGQFLGIGGAIATETGSILIAHVVVQDGASISAT